MEFFKVIVQSIWWWICRLKIVGEEKSIELMLSKTVGIASESFGF
jgi:hypothetical protein